MTFASSRIDVHQTVAIPPVAHAVISFQVIDLANFAHPEGSKVSVLEGLYMPGSPATAAEPICALGCGDYQDFRGCPIDACDQGPRPAG